MIAVLRFLFVIPIGFVAGCLAAAAALLWPFIDLPPGMLDDPVMMIELFLGFMAQAGMVGAAVLVPWAIFMVLTEIFALPSILLHLGAGLAGGLALSRAWYGEAAASGTQTALIVGGLAFMLVYWILAGRSAGHWRRRSRPATPPSTEGQMT
ncbi:hypothetical protein [Aureimonas populi]|uniref:DUF4345 domain-containing protein n=1 Tax=Aureimonas populi TaxID=1701758 RepID=A0ABW5CMZ9_9HYPH|nr:hypothetical protein [Aureimonas populi]